MTCSSAGGSCSVAQDLAHTGEHHVRTARVNVSAAVSHCRFEVSGICRFWVSTETRRTLDCERYRSIVVAHSRAPGTLAKSELQKRRAELQHALSRPSVVSPFYFWWAWRALQQERTIAMQIVKELSRQFQGNGGC